ncbi:MAG: hypothetical protein FJ318_08615 [SAR202 cluster bacterium]|nr:hypothetical protein [SAR202 cluster bacterium]
MQHTCPVCGYAKLRQPPRDAANNPSMAECPSCAFTFGVTDDRHGQSYDAWRRLWIDAGMLWAEDPDHPPFDWNPPRQLQAAGLATPVPWPEPALLPLDAACAAAWPALADIDEEARRDAATEVGRGWLGTRDPTVARRLAVIVLDRWQGLLVRSTAYKALLDVLGYPRSHPKRYFDFFGPMDAIPIDTANDTITGVDWRLLERAADGDAPEAER